MRITRKVHTHTDLIEKEKCQCHKKSNRNLWNYGTSCNIQKEQIKNSHLPKISLLSQIVVKVQAPLCSNDSI